MRYILDEHFYTYNNIQFYDEIPTGWEAYYKYRVAGVDLAISDKQTADYTAVVTAEVYVVNKKTHIFILPHVFNKRISFVETTKLIKSLHEDPELNIFVESNGYQRSLSQTLESQQIEVTPIDTGTMSKRERLSLTVPWHINGQIHLPKTGAEHFLNQLTGFGNEKHDDMVDAFALAVNQIILLSKEGRYPSRSSNNIPIAIEVVGMYRSPIDDLLESDRRSSYEITDDGIRRY